MSKLTKMAFLAGVLALSAVSATPRADAVIDCSTVRCLPCPEGQHLTLTPPNCCKCVKD
jgi:hypothetical protein